MSLDLFAIVDVAGVARDVGFFCCRRDFCIVVRPNGRELVFRCMEVFVLYPHSHIPYNYDPLYLPEQEQKCQLLKIVMVTNRSYISEK